MTHEAFDLTPRLLSHTPASVSMGYWFLGYLGETSFLKGWKHMSKSHRIKRTESGV